MKEIHSYHNEKQRRAQSENGQQDEECIEEVRERISFFSNASTGESHLFHTILLVMSFRLLPFPGFLFFSGKVGSFFLL